MSAVAVKTRVDFASYEITHFDFSFNHKASDNTPEVVAVLLCLARTGPGTTIPYHTLPWGGTVTTKGREISRGREGTTVRQARGTTHCLFLPVHVLLAPMDWWVLLLVPGLVLFDGLTTAIPTGLTTAIPCGAADYFEVQVTPCTDATHTRTIELRRRPTSACTQPFTAEQLQFQTSCECTIDDYWARVEECSPGINRTVRAGLLRMPVSVRRRWSPAFALGNLQHRVKAVGILRNGPGSSWGVAWLQSHEEWGGTLCILLQFSFSCSLVGTAQRANAKDAGNLFLLVHYVSHSFWQMAENGGKMW